MSFSSGVFSLVAGNPVVTGTTVSSTWANNTLTDIATGLSTCILKDGTQTTTVLVPFAQGINSTLTTDSTSSTTGSIITAGGLGVAKSLGVGGQVFGNAAMLSPIKNSLAAGVDLNNTANYFDGPSVAQGTSGTWFVSGTVTIYDTAAAQEMYVKLWDGTTVIASAAQFTTAAGGGFVTCSLSGFITSPAGNLRISVRDPGTTTGHIAANETGAAKDSTITAIRIG